MQIAQEKQRSTFSTSELFLGRIQAIAIDVFNILIVAYFFFGSKEYILLKVLTSLLFFSFLFNDIRILRKNWNNEIDFQVIPYKNSLRTLFFDYSAKKIRGILSHYKFVSVRKFVINLDNEDEILIVHKAYLFSKKYALYRSNFDSEEEWLAIREKFKHVMQ